MFGYKTKEESAILADYNKRAELIGFELEE